MHIINKGVTNYRVSSTKNITLLSKYINLNKHDHQQIPPFNISKHYFSHVLCVWCIRGYIVNNKVFAIAMMRTKALYYIYEKIYKVLSYRIHEQKDLVGMMRFLNTLNLHTWMRYGGQDLLLMQFLYAVLELEIYLVSNLAYVF